MSNINFFFEDIEAIHLPTSALIDWLEHTSEAENHTISNLNYILCSDEHLYNINVEYLNHSYYTDVITFDNSEESSKIEGDIFISIERISENARSIGVSQLHELRRVLVHGLLHLLGYNDKTPEEKDVMTEKENAFLSLPQFQF
ncbi:MAG: rRNA maturation RNase YbeY [Reichenbachiella sp.]